MRTTSQLRKILILNLFLFLGNFCYSQALLSGSVTDQSEAPVEFADILVFDTRSNLKGIGLTDEEGNFSIKLKDEGVYLLKVRFMADILYSDTIKLSMGERNFFSLIVNSAVSLNEITIVGHKKVVEKQLNGLVYNVSNSIMSTGYNAADVMKNIPRIDPFSDQLKIVGKSKVALMVNGRLLNISEQDISSYLSSIPSDNIEKIEVITSPSAKYDASGNSGLINIVLKKNDRIGFDGNIAATYRQRTKAGIDLSSATVYSSEKLSISLSLYGSKEEKFQDRENDFIYTHSIRNTIARRKDTFKGFSANTGIHYKISSNSNAGILFNAYSSPITEESNSFTTFKSMNKTDSTQNSPYTNHWDYNYLTTSAYYDINLDSLGKKLKFNYTFTRQNDKTQKELYSTSYIGDSEVETEKSRALDNGENNYKVHKITADAELPFSFLNAELGGSTTFISNKADMSYYQYEETHTLPVNRGSNNLFEYDESIYAIYISANKSLGEKFSVRTGIRYEHTRTEGRSVTVDTIFNHNFNNLFPSVQLLYNPNDNHSFSTGYSKRISRPAIYDINPNKIYTDFYSYGEGNPALQPSITHNIEVGYVFKDNFTIDLYTSLTNDASDYITLTSANDPYIISRPVNLYKQTAFGLDISYNWRPFRWFNTYNSGNIYYNYSKSYFPEITTEDFKGYGYFISTMNTFTVSKKTRLFVNFQQKFPSYEGMTKVYNRANLQLGGSWRFLDNKLILNVAYRDVFKQGISRVREEYQEFTYKGKSYSDNRCFIATVTWKYGNNKSKKVNREVDTSYQGRMTK